MTAYEMLAGNDRPGTQPTNWKKCSLSYSTGGCVEVADGARDLVRVRDSKNPSGTVLGFSWAGWTMFVGEIQRGKFDPR
jgi:hypothetical protein